MSEWEMLCEFKKEVKYTNISCWWYYYYYRGRPLSPEKERQICNPNATLRCDVCADTLQMVAFLHRVKFLTVSVTPTACYSSSH